MINRLSDFGHNFQVKSVGLYLSDKEFLATIQDILDFDCYESESMRWIVKQCKEYFDQYKNTITLDVFKVKVQDIKSEVLKTTVVEDLKQIHRALGAEDLDYIKDKRSSIISKQRLSINGDLLRFHIWHDNEYGYCFRIYDAIRDIQSR